LVKAMIFLARRPDLSREAFRDWWLGSHRALAEQLPGLRRHTFNLVDDGPYDAVVEQWFDSADTMAACYDTDAGKAVIADSAAHVANRRRVIVEEFAFDVPPTTLGT
jgi:uncharacterized protein (TIGR02118 family)